MSCARARSVKVLTRKILRQNLHMAMFQANASFMTWNKEKDDIFIYSERHF